MSKNYFIKTSLTGKGDTDLPMVALVGRPNVGKSTLFNRLTASKRAIIDANPGMTRDRLYGTVHREQGSYRLVDTGGIEERPDLIVEMIRQQTHQAIAEAAVIVFMIDGRSGVTAGDEEIAGALRKVGKPVILFVNKLDRHEANMVDTGVYSWGFNKIVTGSGEHNLGMDDLREAIDGCLEGAWRMPKADEDEEAIRLAIIGRPNAGKSSIVNRILNEERVMVSNVPGTTRDPIDSWLNFRKRTFCLVDTAGIRRRGKIEGSQESLSVMMAKRQVEAADIIVLLIDATDSGAQQDGAIAGIADDAYKPIIVVVNKWDLIEDKQTNTAKEFESRIRRRLKFLETSPFIFVSAKTGQRVSKVLDLAMDMYDRMTVRVTTGVLNRFVADMAKNYKIPTYRGRGFKIFYITQVETKPPTFVIIINQKKPLHFTQHRFLVNRIREAFDLDGIPLKLIIKPRSDKEQD